VFIEGQRGESVDQLGGQFPDELVSEVLGVIDLSGCLLTAVALRKGSEQNNRGDAAHYLLRGLSKRPEN